MTADAICPHLWGDLPTSMCEVCSHGYARLLAKTAKQRKQAARKEKPLVTAKKDPVIARIEAYASGYWCEVCETPRDDHGFCAHERLERFNRQRSEMLAWHASQAGTGHKKLIAGAVMAGMSREVLRDGLGYSKSEYAGIDSRTAIAAQTRQLVGVRPAWREHRQNIADDLPV